MSKAKRFVFRASDAPIFENPAKTMQDMVMVTEDSCGSLENTAGLFWLAPHEMGGEGESHSGIVAPVCFTWRETISESKRAMFASSPKTTTIALKMTEILSLSCFG